MIEDDFEGVVKHNSMNDRRAVLAKMLAMDYISIASVNLNTGSAVIFQSAADRELEGQEVPWEALIKRYAIRRACPDDRAGVLSLTTDSIEEIFRDGRNDHSIRLRCLTDEKLLVWVEIRIIPVSREEKEYLVTTRYIDQEHLMQKIVDLFVYQSLDYLILMDVKHNTYTIYSARKDGVPVPPEDCSNYTEEMIRFNQVYVVPEDVEWVTANMQISYVVKMLELENAYSFSCGSITEGGKYRRTLVKFQYYDKSMGLVLLTRTDVTQIYKEEQIKSEQLSMALRMAQSDALTGLFNTKATKELISGLLGRQYRSQAVFMFVDIDNFKMVNDTLGHHRGDELLKYLACCIEKVAGWDGIAGRVGGDEFLLFMPSVTTMKEIEEYAQRICSVFCVMPEEELRMLPISCSVGISVYPRDGTDYETLVRKADQAMYTSKRYGKNRHYFYSDEQFPPK